MRRAMRPAVGSAILRVMVEVLALVLPVVRAALRRRSDLIAENLLRHQLAVLTRSTRKRRAVRSGDKLLWVVARRLCRDWRRLSGYRLACQADGARRWAGPRLRRGRDRACATARRVKGPLAPLARP
jgi:hypothetical protein